MTQETSPISPEREPSTLVTRGMSLREFALLWNDGILNRTNAPWATISAAEEKQGININTVPQPQEGILMLFENLPYDYHSPGESKAADQFPTNFPYDVAVTFELPQDLISYRGKGTYRYADYSAGADADYAHMYEGVSAVEAGRIRSAGSWDEHKDELGVMELKKDWITGLHFPYPFSRKDLEASIDETMLKEGLDDSSHDIVAMWKIMPIIQSIFKEK